MKRARVAYLGAVHDAVEEEGRLRLADGRLVGESAVELPGLPALDGGPGFWFPGG